MSTLRVDTITNEAGNGPPNFPNGLAVSLLAPLAGSTANALLLDLTTPVAGTQISFIPTDPNTGAVTINGAPALAMKDGGSAMPAGYLLAGEITRAEWNGSAWLVRRREVTGGNATDGFFRQTEAGFQECWVSRSVTPVANTFTSVTWTFPVPFATSRPTFSVTADTATTAVQNASFTGSTATSVGIGLVRSNTAWTTLDATAKGPWY